MGRRVVSGGCHPAEQKNDDFRSWMEVGRVSGSFILRSAQQRRLFIASGTLSGAFAGQEEATSPPTTSPSSSAAALAAAAAPFSPPPRSPSSAADWLDV
ncbi:unnamed protein product [Spirodela intermedia]|uniref:Uncharacterized protein n=1 Tax=Spirodela intermedia TaxID=51605 RepID=A0ABN7EDK5_SPIIN|nr:unnamed protein product [Spirodela intermedia]